MRARVEMACRALPQREQCTEAKQLRTASRSVVANDVEAFVRQDAFPKYFKRWVTYSQGSCDETKFWLEYVAAIGLIAEEEAKKLLKDYAEVGRLLNP